MSDQPIQIVIPNSELVPEGTPSLTKRVTDMKVYNRKLPDFIVALAISKTKGEAAIRIRMSPQWFSSFPGDVQLMVMDLAEELRLEPLLLAKTIISEGVVMAAMVKMRGLSARRENDRQRAATEILDRNLGKSNQQITKDVRIEIVSNLAWGKQRAEN